MGPGEDPASKSFRGNSSLSQLCLSLFLQAHKTLGWRADTVEGAQSRRLGVLEGRVARRSTRELKGGAEFQLWTMRSQNWTPRRTEVKQLASSLPGMRPRGTERQRLLDGEDRKGRCCASVLQGWRVIIVKSSAHAEVNWKTKTLNHLNVAF